MAVFLFLIFENFLIGGMFSILETIKTDKSTLILQNKNWCQMINPMCTTFQMWSNCILQNQVCFERLISLSKTPYIFVKISILEIETPAQFLPCLMVIEQVVTKQWPINYDRLLRQYTPRQSYGRFLKHKNEHAGFTQFLWYLVSVSTTCLLRCCENVI